MPGTSKQRLIAGLDVGGTKFVAVLGRSDGERVDVVAQRRAQDWSSGSWRDDLDTLASELARLLEEADVASDRLAAIGICAPGPLDRRRVIEAPNLPGWRDVPIVDTLARAFDAPVSLENDANAAALAEWRYGAGQGARSCIFLTMSTGLGAGLILDGRLHRGARFGAGEIGHAPVVPNGRPCSCGLRGCLEAYTGGAALAERMREDVAKGQARHILDLAGGDAGAIDAALWVRAIRDGDAYAQALREEFLDHLAQGVVILLATLDPECLVFGTIIRENADLFLEPLGERVRARTWPVLHDVRLVPGALGDDLPAYAALSVAELAALEGEAGR